MYGWAWRYAPHVAVAAALGLGAIYIVHTLREQGRAELKPEIERLERALAAEQADRARAEAASASYRSEMDALRSRPVPRTPVRLCVNPAPVPETITAPARADDRTSLTWGFNGTAGSDFEAGPDIGPDLYDLAAKCDAEVAKLRALQGWVNDVR